MSQVTVTINKQDYNIACDNGQETHLARLANYVDHRCQELKAAVGNIRDDRLLVMVALLLSDELSDAYTELETIKSADEGAAKFADQQRRKLLRARMMCPHCSCLKSSLRQQIF